CWGLLPPLLHTLKFSDSSDYLDISPLPRPFTDAGPVHPISIGPRTPTSLPVCYPCGENPTVSQGSAALEALLARRLLFLLPPPSAPLTLHREHGAACRERRIPTLPPSAPALVFTALAACPPPAPA